jgi:hypothetical protein
VDDMVKNMPRIYAALDNIQANRQPPIIEVEGKIDNHPIDILIDSRASNSYIDMKIVESFKFKRHKYEKSWLVQIATRTKRKINEIFKDFLVSMNGDGTKADLNIIPLGSYACLIGMNWLDKHRVILDFYKRISHALMMKGIRGQCKVFQDLYP